MKKLLFLIFFILLISNVNAEKNYIIEHSYVGYGFNSICNAAQDGLFYNGINTTIIYYILPDNFTSISYLNFYIFGITKNTEIYQTEPQLNICSYNYSTKFNLTNKLVSNFIPIADTFNNITLSGLTNKYIAIKLNQSDYSGLSYILSPNYSDIDFRPYITEQFGFSGYVRFLDTDNNIYPLSGAFIYYNNTINTTADINGFFNIFNVLNSTDYKFYVIKNGAFNTDNYIFNSSNTFHNFTLQYSKPQLSNPVINGNYIETTFSHNFKSINLWENPSFVWGIYNYSNHTYFKNCENFNTNKFRCDIVPNTNFLFKFEYSDIYNMNLSMYHPFLNGERVFYTNENPIANISLQNSNLVTQLSAKSQPERENILSNYFWDFILIMIIIILIAFWTTYNKDEEIYYEKPK